LGGFGNLPGTFELYDPRKLKVVGDATAHCSAVQLWSPNSRFLLCGVLSPRIRVDNGFTIFYYDGTEVYTEQIEELFDCMWQPSLPKVYPSVPLSPRVYERSAKAAQPDKPDDKPKSTGAYVPPALRNKQRTGPSSVTAALRGNQETDTKRYSEKERRQQRSASQLVEDIGNGIPGGPVGGEDLQMNSKQKSLAKLKEKKRAAAAAKRKQEQNKKPELLFGDDFDQQKAVKRITAIERSLRSIERLQEKKDNGEDLSAKQKKLLESADKLKAEKTDLEEQCEKALGI